ncbi:Na+/H+ antiporter [Cryptosporangium sp. NPDC051539]|uniref:Na+/H+ antiporter n=1 Tax=Cryptosporangium sp. NPDC051539 TaxID=3363962 RepID=UPI0037B83A36
MTALELLVAVGLAILVCNYVARRIRVAPPAVLLVGGVLLGFLPPLREIELPPDVVLLLFLPVLLYWEAFTSSLREIRVNQRIIVLTSTVLVAATAALVAVTAHLLGVPWGPAWVLGAAVAPTDATAVGVLGRGLPRRVATMMRAESLVNDGTALVIYGLAVAVTVGDEHFSVPRLGEMFGVAYGGGIAVGALITWLSLLVRRRLRDPAQHNLLALVTPLGAYLLAEQVHASGVLAVVVSGLWVSQVSPRHFPADAREHVHTVMTFVTSLLNGALFVLIGIQIHGAVRGLTSTGLTRGLTAVLAVSAAVVLARFLFFFTSPYVIRLLDHRPKQRRLRMTARPRTVLAAAGFRGAVSLAAALAVPELLDNGTPFPDRDLIVFVTAGVIAVTLLVQAPLLPGVVRWAGLRPDGPGELRRAEIAAVQAALDALPQVVERLHPPDAVVDQVRTEYDRHLRALRAGETDDADDRSASDDETQYLDLRLALIAEEHATIVRLRDADDIDDDVLRRIQADLDVEKSHLARHRPT